MSCCVWDYLVCVFESEYLKDRFLLISNLNNAKKIKDIPIKGCGYSIIMYQQTGIFGLSHFGLLLLQITSHYLGAVPGYLYFTEPLNDISLC